MQKLLNKNSFNGKALRQLGPGLITGAADDDSSGIATYSQAGAQFGFGMLWTAVFTFPLMTGIQIVSARIGYVTGQGLAANIGRVFPRRVLLLVVWLLVIANTINIAADLAAMGDALQLMVAGPQHVYSVAFGLFCLMLQIFMPYQQYVHVLKWLTLSLLAYVAVVFSTHIPWATVARHTVFPGLDLSAESLAMIVAVFGTTISPYLFFWQAAQEVQDMRAADRIAPVHNANNDAPAHLRRIKIDTYVGMAFSNLIAFFIILSCGITLNVAGIHEIHTSAQAASALRPLAGNAAFALFALGIIGTGLLAIPVLAGSAAYAMADSYGWPQGLDRKWFEAREFYAIIVAATLIGAALDFTRIDPIQALVWSAVLNGVISVPIMAVMMLMATRPTVMGPYVISRRLKWLGWLATTVMALAVFAMLATW